MMKIIILLGLLLLVGCSTSHYENTMRIDDCCNKFVHEKGIDFEGQVFIAYPQFCCITKDNALHIDEDHCYLPEEVFS